MMGKKKKRKEKQKRNTKYNTICLYYYRTLSVEDVNELFTSVDLKKNRIIELDELIEYFKKGFRPWRHTFALLEEMQQGKYEKKELEREDIYIEKI